MVVVDNDSSKQRQGQTTTVCKIGRRATRGKEESGWQRTTALGRKCEKINKSSLRQNTFFNNTVCPVGFFAPTKTANVPFLVYQSYIPETATV